jgi:hypothetical protein
MASTPRRGAEQAITHKPRETGKGKERTHTIMRKSTTTFQRATNTRRSLRLRKRSKSLLLRPSEGSSKECSFEGLGARENKKKEKKEEHERKEGVQFEVENRGPVHDESAANRAQVIN